MSKYNITLLIFILLFQFKSYGQSYCNYDSIVFTIDIKHDSIYKLEPIFYEVSVENLSSKAKVLQKVWHNQLLYPIIEYQLEGDSSWYPLASSQVGIDLITSNSQLFDTVVYEPNKKYSISLNWLSIPCPTNFFTLDTVNNGNFYQLGNLLSISGHHKLRVKSFNTKLHCSKSLISNEVAITIQNRKNLDRDAENWLISNTKYPAFIYESIWKDGKWFGIYSENTLYVDKVKLNEIAEEFIRLFPNSSLTPWAKLYLSYWHFKGYKYYSYGDNLKIESTYGKDRVNKDFLSRLDNAKKLLQSISLTPEDKYNQYLEKAILLLLDKINKDIRKIETKSHREWFWKEYQKQYDKN